MSIGDTLAQVYYLYTKQVALTACTAPQAQAGMPNPASVYCEQNGNKLEIRTAADGSQNGICVFPDGSACDEWAYYRGECGPAAQKSQTPAMFVEATTEASGGGSGGSGGTEEQASGGYMPPGATEEITDWWGVIKSTEPGAQYDDYFERQDFGQIIYNNRKGRDTHNRTYFSCSTKHRTIILRGSLYPHTARRWKTPPQRDVKATSIRYDKSERRSFLVHFQELSMPKGIPLTEEEQAKRRHEIFHQVVNIFLKKGFQETSMREIAEAAGLGKSTLYDYFKTKDEILIYFFEDQLNDLTAEAQRIALQNMDADQRLRQIMEMHLEFLVENKNLFLKLSIEAQRLKLESQKRIQNGRYAYQDLLRGLIEEGIREGAFRKVDPLLAARLLVHIMAPVVFASRPTGTPQEMLKETLDIFLKGLQV